ncbi:MAG: AAA family ATPase, partial [Deltaproteobacteria bacterium]|nr:AAA family ATPase [Deltaproteobacteria bacterium]
MYCRHCGYENPEGMKFCGQCGISLTAQTCAVETLGPRPQTLYTRPILAERRQLTVMFCDLVGSTPLSERLDPEELYHVVLTYQAMCEDVIRRFEGYVAQYQGDGLLVYFGYPQAHEDDAARAVRSGLGILAELQHSNRRLQRTIRGIQESPLQLRIGIHSGLVVVGEIGVGARREQIALGETPNIAARLQGLAEPDSLVISAATYRLTEGLFTCHDRGAYELKGISAPVQVYQALGESEIQSRFEVAVARGLTPLVGREQEMELLLRHWRHVTAGGSRSVFLSGEAGIGKSRLVQALKEYVARESHGRIECRCSPYAQHSAFFPLFDLLQRVLQFKRDDLPEDKFRKLEDLLERQGQMQRHAALSFPEAVPLLASLLSLPLPDRYTLPDLPPQRLRQKLFDVLSAWLQAMAERYPTLFVVEDLQWSDPSTLELLHFFVNRRSAAHILTIFAARPEFHPPWQSSPEVTTLILPRLPRLQVEELLGMLTKRKMLPAEVVTQIVSKTDGVPLFVEELTEMVLESGLLKEHVDRYELAGPLPPLAIPATLHDSLMARLDRLATAKEVAQLGATLGREFPYDLIQAVSPLHEATLQKGLARLVEADLLSQRGFPPQARYTFKHALIQETAYQSLLKSKRQQYHQQIAQILEVQFPESTDTQPELLAYHYSEAGVREKALVYWQKAGHQAMERSAHTEAISHFTKGLAVLKTFPDTPERAQQELALSIALGAPLLTVKGHTAPEVEQTYARARELCRQVGETPQLFQTLLGLVRFYAVRGAFQTAHELSEQCLSLAQNVHDPALLSWAHCFLGETLFHTGELIAAREQVEQGIAFYDPQYHRPLASLYGQDPKVGCLYFAALA